jgi:GT2 family glycosyltransferase
MRLTAHEVVCDREPEAAFGGGLPRATAGQLGIGCLRDLDLTRAKQFVRGEDAVEHAIGVDVADVLGIAESIGVDLGDLLTEIVDGIVRRRVGDVAGQAPFGEALRARLRDDENDPAEPAREETDRCQAVAKPVEVSRIAPNEDVANDVAGALSHLPTFSVVIPAHNEGAHVRSTVEAVLRSSGTGVEIVVIDDGSSDGCCDFLESARPGVVVLERQERAGVAGARRRGAELAAGGTLVFLDAHCEPQPGWLDAMAAALDEHDAGIVAPCIVDAQQPEHKGYGAKPVDRMFTYRWLPRRAVAPYDVPIAGGGCMMMRRQRYGEIGGFDRMRRFGIEDVEISLRSWLFGYPVIVVPDVEVAHVFRAERIAAGWADAVHNALRTAVLHFDGERLTRIVAHLRSRPGFADAAQLLFDGDLFERREFVRSLRVRDAAWWCERFAVEL